MTPQEIAQTLLTQKDKPNIEAILQDLRPELTSEVLRALAIISLETSQRDPREGFVIAEFSALVADVMDTEEAYAIGCWNKGNACIPLNKYDEAIHYFHEAEGYYAKAGKEEQVAGLQINQVLIYRDLGDYQHALSLAEKARKTCMAAESETTDIYLANLELNIGWVYQELGEFEKGIESYKNSRHLYLKHHDPRSADVDMDLANLLEAMDQFVEAERLLQEALEAFTEAKNVLNIPRACLNLGRVSIRRGQYQLALEYLEKAHSGYSEIPLPVEIAEVNLFRLQVYLQLQLFKEVIILSRDVISVFQRNGMQRELIQCLYYQGIAYERLGLWETAVKMLAKARQLVYQQGAWRQLWLVDTKRAELLQQHGEVAKAYRIARRVENKVDTRQYPAIFVRLNILLGQCALTRQTPDFAEARQRGEKALAIITSYHLPEAEVHCRQLLARTFALSGEKESAWQMQQAAVDVCEYMRANLLTDEFQLGFMEDKLPVYSDIIQTAHQRVQEGALSPANLLNFLNMAQKAPLLLDNKMLWQGNENQEEEAAYRQALTALQENWHWHYQNLLLTNEASEHRSKMDAASARQQLTQIEAEIGELRRRQNVRRSYFEVQETSSQSSDDSELLSNLQNQLQSDEALVHYYEVSGRLQTLILTKNACHIIQDLVSVELLTQQLNAWQFYVAYLQGKQISQTNSAMAQAHLSRLYQSVWQPIHSCLQDSDHLYLILPPAWQIIPISALFDGKQYVVERWELAYLSFAEGLFRDSGIKQEENNNAPVATVMGYSDAGSVPHTVKEAEAVAQILTPHWTTQLFVETAVTRKQVVAASETSKLLHLATHAVFREDNPLFSWLALAEERMTVADLYDLRLQQRPFIVLSGCETGRGKPHGGGLLGMGRGLLAAGATGLLLTLWPIEDQHSAELMKLFYAKFPLYAAGLPAREIARALRVAQLMMLSTGISPFYWSGYIYLAG